MDAKEFSQYLCLQAQIIGDKSNPLAAALEDFGGAFDGVASKKVIKVVEHIQRHWHETNRDNRYPAALKSKIDLIRQSLQKAKAVAAVKDFEAVATLFKGEPNSTVAHFVEEVSQAITAPPPSKTTKKQKRTALDPSAIRAIADQLTAASSNNEKFDAAFAELKSAKFSEIELLGIAEHFLGYKKTYKGKPAILKAIKNRQFQDAVQDSRDRRPIGA